MNNFQQANQVQEKLNYLIENNKVSAIMVSTISIDNKELFCVKIMVKNPETSHKDLGIEEQYEDVPVIIAYQTISLL